jgi:hypothetical protein
MTPPLPLVVPNVQPVAPVLTQVNVSEPIYSNDPSSPVGG